MISAFGNKPMRAVNAIITAFLFTPKVFLPQMHFINTTVKSKESDLEQE